MFTKTMVQGPTHLANIGAGAFSTWNAVYHTFPAIDWFWVLELGQLPFLDILRTEKKMASSAPLCTVRPPTQISIYAVTPTILQPTSELW